MKAKSYASNLSIKRKLTLLLLIPCLAVLLLVGGILFWFQIKMFRTEFAKDMHAVAEIVGANSTAAVAFSDRKAATEILNSLEAKKYISSAVLLLPDKTIFAQYGNHTSQLVLGAEPQFVFRDRDALMVEPVRLEGQQLATLNIVGDYRAVYTGLLKLVGWMLVILAVVGAGVAVLLSNWLQRFISDPVLRLAETAQSVADKHDYSVRAHVESGAELGVLTRTFNQMLARIQEQDHALSSSQKKIATLINSIEGIVWEWDSVAERFTFVSSQSERILGHKPEQWLADPKFWNQHLHPEDAAKAISQCQDNSCVDRPYIHEYRMVAADGRTVWIREIGCMVTEDGKPVAARGIFEDITEQKTAAAEVERLNRSLVETSRMAGMAEVATGVLHNVGNVLNSVSVSATLVSDRLRQSKLTNLRRATQMLAEPNGSLAQFLTDDPKGKVLPQYLRTAAELLADEQADVLKEVASLNHNIEHIKEIVAMQQNYAKVSGAFEHLNPVELIEDAIRMNTGAFERHRIEVVREYAPNLPKVNVDRHKVLQILVNLMRNARHALDAGAPAERRLVVKVDETDNAVTIRVRDNGMGIAPDNLTRIFQHGFTTKKEGHGFGLHSGANAAKEMRGQLSASSAGLGKGAEFILRIPTAPQETGFIHEKKH